MWRLHLQSDSSLWRGWRISFEMDNISFRFTSKIFIFFYMIVGFWHFKNTFSYNLFQIFKWLDFRLDKQLNYDDMTDTFLYLQEKQVDFDENKIFDQSMNLIRFIEKKREEEDLQFFKKSCNDKICIFFSANRDECSYSEILKIAKFFFAIPGHNANCERSFSLIKSQWTDERNQLSVSTVRSLISIKMNFKSYSCVEFYNYLMDPKNSELLRLIANSEKYCKKWTVILLLNLPNRV